MRVLITGAAGFIGSAFARALSLQGHRLVCCIHRDTRRALPPGVEQLRVDYMRDLTPDVWRPRLAGIDAVVNAVGILRETPTASFAALHHLAPAALFRACHQAGVGRVIQVSALGAGGQADDAWVSDYHRSKWAADDALCDCDLDWTIVRPSVVFGSGGASSALFLKLASLPVVPLVGRGQSQLQPIHIDDLVETMLRLLEPGCGHRAIVPAVGPVRMTLRQMLALYRRAIGMRPAPMLSIPLPVVRLAARVGDRLRDSALTSDTLQMLLRGNSASVGPITRLLGRPPRAPEGFVAVDAAASLRLQAVWSWLRTLLTLSLALVWICAGVVSWFFAADYGLGLLARLGLDGPWAAIGLLGACVVDVSLGVWTLLWPGRRLWAVQLSVMLFYSVALTLVAPELWTDPFGPLVKNLPLGLLLLGLLSLEP